MKGKDVIAWTLQHLEILEVKSGSEGEFCSFVGSVIPLFTSLCLGNRNS